MVTAKTPAKTPAKKPAAKKAPVKRTAPKAVVTPKVTPVKAPTNLVGTAVDLIKWVDSPFKLVAVIVLTLVLGTAALVWDSRVVILNAITNAKHEAQMKEVKVLEHVAQVLQKDLEAQTVVVHKVVLVVNGRTTLLAYNAKGRDNSLDGFNSTLFGKDPQRNAAVVAMMNGEVHCDKLEVSGKTSDWEAKNGVKYICRGSIPPEMGAFEGYISVGFTEEPADLGAVKTRINLAATEMAK
jgi:hypothetical protein